MTNQLRFIIVSAFHQDHMQEYFEHVIPTTSGLQVMVGHAIVRAEIITDT